MRIVFMIHNITTWLFLHKNKTGAKNSCTLLSQVSTYENTPITYPANSIIELFCKT
jgi:hypothetical protein